MNRMARLLPAHRHTGHGHPVILSERFLDYVSESIGSVFRYFGPFAALINRLAETMLAIEWKPGFEFGIDAIIPISICQPLIACFCTSSSDSTSQPSIRLADRGRIPISPVL